VSPLRFATRITPDAYVVRAPILVWTASFWQRHGRQEIVSKKGFTRVWPARQRCGLGTIRVPMESGAAEPQPQVLDCGGRAIPQSGSDAALSLVPPRTLTNRKAVSPLRFANLAPPNLLSSRAPTLDRELFAGADTNRPGVKPAGKQQDPEQRCRCKTKRQGIGNSRHRRRYCSDGKAVEAESIAVCQKVSTTVLRLP